MEEEEYLRPPRSQATSWTRSKFREDGFSFFDDVFDIVERRLIYKFSSLEVNGQHFAYPGMFGVAELGEVYRDSFINAEGEGCWAARCAARVFHHSAVGVDFLVYVDCVESERDTELDGVAILIGNTLWEKLEPRDLDEIAEAVFEEILSYLERHFDV